MGDDLANGAVLGEATEAFVHLLDYAEFLALGDGAGAFCCFFGQVVQFHVLNNHAVESDRQFLLWEVRLVQYSHLHDHFLLFDWAGSLWL